MNDSVSRTATIDRTTKESQVHVELDLDGTGKAQVSTGVGFYDHMLQSFARHALIDLAVHTVGDTQIDAHHTVEDTGILLGEVFKQALGDKAGVRRFASNRVPLDEALVDVALDLSGRPFLVYEVEFPGERILGTPPFDPQLVEEFWRAFATEARITLHLDGIRGDNAHHVIEATFKAAARALDAATRIDPRRGDAIPSTKGAL